MCVSVGIVYYRGLFGCVYGCVCEWTGLWFCENQSCLNASLISTFLKKCDLEGGGVLGGPGTLVCMPAIAT